MKSRRGDLELGRDDCGGNTCVDGMLVHALRRHEALEVSTLCRDADIRARENQTNQKFTHKKKKKKDK